MSPSRQTADGSAMTPGREDFDRVGELYDVAMPENNHIHDLIYPRVYGEAEYIGQFSDNSASELLAMGQAVGLDAGSSVLDLGCGTAAIACFLARQLGWKVTGIDLSRAALEKACRRVASSGLSDQLQLVAGNVYDQAFATLFDGIYGTGSFCHFEASRLFPRCRQLLRRGGRLAFMERIRLGEIPDQEWKQVTEAWACPDVYSVEEYRSALVTAGFEVLDVRDQTETFRGWQDRSVLVRREMRRRIIELTSEAYYDTSLRMAAYENEQTRMGRFGYVRIISEAV